VIISHSATDSTGRLDSTDNYSEMGNSENTNNQVKVEILDYGPVKITGNFIVKDLKRNTEVTLNEVYLCRCGKSSNKPFCDESHKR